MTRPTGKRAGPIQPAPAPQPRDQAEPPNSAPEQPAQPGPPALGTGGWFVALLWLGAFLLLLMTELGGLVWKLVH